MAKYREQGWSFQSQVYSLVHSFVRSHQSRLLKYFALFFLHDLYYATKFQIFYSQKCFIGNNMLYLSPIQVGNTGLFVYYEEMSNDTAQIKCMSISLSSISEFILHVCSVWIMLVFNHLLFWPIMLLFCLYSCFALWEIWVFSTFF